MYIFTHIRSFHETYHGERSVDKITEWAENFVKQENKEIKKTRNVDVDRDGVCMFSKYTAKP